MRRFLIAERDQASEAIIRLSRGKKHEDPTLVNLIRQKNDRRSKVAT
jgi:hypothetical protein